MAIDLGNVKGATGATGAQGPTGATGPKGDAATITVNSTTTGAAGSNASVTNAGTQYAAKLNFTIPRGNTGATGAQGPQGPQGTPGIDSLLFDEVTVTLNGGGECTLYNATERTVVAAWLTQVPSDVTLWAYVCLPFSFAGHGHWKCVVKKSENMTSLANKTVTIKYAYFAK